MKPDLSELDSLDRRNSGRSLLHLATFDGETNALKRLLQEGAGLNFCN